MKFGVHVNRAGGLGNALAAARTLRCDTIQMFSRSPRSLRPGLVNEEEATLFREGLAAAGIGPLVIHAPYLLNLASPRKETYEASRDALAHDIVLARAVGAEMLVFHPGSHLGSGVDAGIARIAAAVEYACEKACHTSHGGSGGRRDEGVDRMDAVLPRLLLEMVSGSGTEIGKTFEEQRRIMDRAPSVPLGVCLDTCHVFTAGYEVRTMEGISRVLDELDAAVGMQSLALVHANDSVGDLGSHLDRHANIGEGRIGEHGFRAILGCSRLSHLPFILETPHTTLDDDARNLAALRRIAGEAVSW
ncbi:MAG: deoxyribonuclease IV [Bacillota bacterium]|nr:deoxyribonuclease IV [Bacillota bacterium]